MHIHIKELMSVFTVYIFYWHEVCSLIIDRAREMHMSSGWPCKGQPRANECDFNKQNVQN